MNPVSLITIHHEGAGNPVDWARGGEGGYSIWIGDVNGDHSYVDLRTPWTSWGTLNFNHVSVDICLSGDRDVAPTTQADIDTIGLAVAHARAQGWVIDHPLVRAHHDSPGSSTVCPGTHTRDPATWLKIVAACNAGPPPHPTPAPVPAPIVKVKPMYDPALVMLPWTAAWKNPDGSIKAAVAANGDVYAFDVPYRRWPTQHTDLANQGAVNNIEQAPGLPAGRYQLTTANGNHYVP